MAESLNKIYKREGKGMSFKEFADKYNQEKQTAPVVEPVFNNFSANQQPVKQQPAKVVNFNYAGSNNNTATALNINTTQALSALFGVATGVVIVVLYFKYKQDG